MGFLSSVVAWKAYAAVGGVAAIAAAIVTWQVTSWQKDARYDRLVASNAVAMQSYADRALAAEAREREEETRRDAARQKIEDETRDQIEKSRASAAAAASELGRVRQQLAAFTARFGNASPNPAADRSGPGVKDTGALDLLAGLFSGHTAELVEVGRYAQQLRAAGLSCERKYDSLKPGTTP